MNRVFVDQISIDALTMRSAVEWIAATVRKKPARAAHVVTVNAQLIQIAHQNPRFREILRRADLSVADGVPLVWASRLLHEPLPERVNGTDLMEQLCKEAAGEGRTLYFLGGKPGAAESTAVRMRRTFPGISIVAVDCPPPGFIDNPEEQTQVAERIGRLRPDIVFVGLGAPTQEYWIDKYSHLPAKVMIGVGGSFELLAGFQRRAPRVFQKAGCEWLWRLSREPVRLWRRYLFGNLLFLYIVLRMFVINQFTRPSRLGSAQ